MSHARTSFDDLLTATFDLRDVLDRFEEIESDIESAHEAEQEAIDDTQPFDQWIAEYTARDTDLDDLIEEYRTIRAFLDEVRGNGGDHQWRGGWYPVHFIEDGYFETYAQELAEDIVSPGWPHSCIDWEQAARELQQDYTAIDIGEQTYWYR